MYSVKADYPSDWPFARVYTFADWHIGDANCKMEDIRAIINKVAEDKYGIALMNGDLMNTALRNSVSDVYSETMGPMAQIDTLVNLLYPIRMKIAGCTVGNHENRIFKNDGIDSMKLVCRELGIEDKYSPEGLIVFISLGVKKDSHHSAPQPVRYSGFLVHGSGGGRKEGAKAIRLADMASIADCDFYIHSHTHLPMTMKQSFYRTNVGNASVGIVEKLFVNTSSALDYGGYGQMQEFKPNSVSNPVIYLDGTTRYMAATL